MINEKDYIDDCRHIIDQFNEDDKMPATAAAIATFLMKFRPADPDEPHSRLFSSDVVDMLEDICTPTLNEVTSVMLYLGYKLTMLPDNYTIYWAVKTADGSEWESF